MTKKKKSKDYRKIAKKVWWFIWEDDSIWSWLVNIVLAFVLIKFIVYPLLGLMLATSHPIVAVVSGSMEHGGSFDEWWESAALCEKDTIKCTQEMHYAEYGISKEEFKKFPFKNGFNRGDIMILYGTKNIEEGDVLVFIGNRPDPIIHRVVDTIDGYAYTTKGDHNPTSFAFEHDIPEENKIGEAKLRIPFLGYIKIWFVTLVSWIGGLF